MLTPNWSGPGVEDYKIAAKLVESEPSLAKEEFKAPKEPEPEGLTFKENFQSLRNSKVTFQFAEPPKEENYVEKPKKPLTVTELGKAILLSPDKNKVALNAKITELNAAIDGLKHEIEATNNKLKFSRELEQLTHETVGKYSIFHMVGALLLAFLIGYYIF